MTPTCMYGKYFPVSVKLPGESNPWHRVKVYITPQGVLVYRAVPIGSDTPNWVSPLTAVPGRPGTMQQLRNGWSVATEAGLVTLTGGGGCGCSNPLKRYNPPFAQVVLPWPS